MLFGDSTNVIRKRENSVPAVIGRGSGSYTVEICWPNRKQKTVDICNSHEIL